MLRFNWNFALFVSFIFLVGCGVKFVESRAVEIQGNSSIEEKLELATKVINKVALDGFHENVKKRFPNATEDELGGITVQLFQWSGTDGGGVAIRCVMKLSKSSGTSAAILDYCESLVANELKSIQGEGSAI